MAGKSTENNNGNNVRKRHGSGESRKSGGSDKQLEMAKTAKEVLAEFFESSTIHGMKYIGRRPLREKLWWITVFIISITICCLQIRSIFHKWRVNPVIITFDQKFRSIGEIPFPAITICVPVTVNGTTFDYGTVMEDLLRDGFNKYDQQMVQLFDITSEMCLKTIKSDETREAVKKLFENYTSGMQPSQKPFFEAADGGGDITTFTGCRGVVAGIWNCSQQFKRINTPEGSCYTFNMLSKDTIIKKDTILGFDDELNNKSDHKPNKWSADYGYDKVTPVVKPKEKTSYPLRTFTTGSKLQVKFNYSIPINPLSTHCFSKAYLYIHHPFDIPWQESNVMPLAAFAKSQQESRNLIKVTPEVVLGDTTLKKSFSPEQRKCYFDGERELRYFAIYSESNCDLECISNVSQELCGCVAFWMPRHKGIPTCGVKDLKCYTRTVYRYLNVEKAFTSAGEINSKNGGYNTQFRCNCLPRCNSITYTFPNDKQLALRPDYDDDESPADIEDDNGNDEGKAYYIKLATTDNQHISIGGFASSIPRPLLPSLTPLREAHVAIAFKRAQILALKRSPFYQLSDFIANVGGLLGLFVGMSLLSVVEVFYFLTLRLIDKCRWQKLKNDEVAALSSSATSLPCVPMVVIMDQDEKEQAIND